MATQGRRSGTRRPKKAATTAPIQTAAAVPAVVEVVEPVAADTSSGEAVLLDERTVAIAESSRGFGFGRSLPAAAIGSLLVVGLAFGATGPGGALGPKSADGKDPAGPGAASAVTTAGGEVSGSSAVDRTSFDDDARDGGYEGDVDGSKDDPDGNAESNETKPGEDADGERADSKDGDGADGKDDDGKDGDGKDGDDKDGPGDEPKKDPQPDPTKKPQPEETKKPQDPKPDPEPADVDPIGLALGIKDEHPVVGWDSCAGLDFDYYKVVRSMDSTVSWPGGSGDEVIAAVERGDDRRAWDKGAPHGDKVWYRVFCVRKTDDGYKVVNASVTKAIEVPEETPPPDPISLGLDANVNDEGKVILTWEACEVDGFAFYKVVRSDWNENPSYLPWSDGSEVIGVVEGLHETEWHDSAPDGGESAYYRVQCIGYHDGQKVLLGESAVVAVATP